MKILQKKQLLETEEYYRKHFEIVNAFFRTKLTEKEIQVLASLLSVDKKFVEEGDIINPYTRKVVMGKIGISSGGLGNYLRSMIDKGILVKSELTKKISIVKEILPEEDEQMYKFKLVRKDV